MGRAYAGVLGYLAAALTLVRGAVSGAGLEGTLLTAIAAMAIFATIGFVLGVIAETTVDHAMQEQLESQLATGTPSVES
ncbi:MAG: hypothetical protein ACR2NU_05575 [Aeoliella sp.]